MSSKKSRGRSPDPRKSPPPKTPPAAGRRAAKKAMESEMTTGQRLERLRLGLGGKESDDRTPASEKVDATASTGEKIDTPAPTGEGVAAPATESKTIASVKDRQRLLAATRAAGSDGGLSGRSLRRTLRVQVVAGDARASSPRAPCRLARVSMKPRCRLHEPIRFINCSTFSFSSSISI